MCIRDRSFSFRREDHIGGCAGECAWWFFVLGRKAAQLMSLLGVRWPGTALVMCASVENRFNKAVPGNLTPRRLAFYEQHQLRTGASWWTSYGAGPQPRRCLLYTSPSPR